MTRNITCTPSSRAILDQFLVRMDTSLSVALVDIFTCFIRERTLYMVVALFRRNLYPIAKQQARTGEQNGKGG